MSPGARPTRPALRFLLPPQGAPPCLSALCLALLALCALGPLPLDYRDQGPQALGVGRGKGSTSPRPLRTLGSSRGSLSLDVGLSPAGPRGPPPRPERHLCGAAGGQEALAPLSMGTAALPPHRKPRGQGCRGPGQRPQPGAGSGFQPGAGPSLSPLGAQGLLCPRLQGTLCSRCLLKRTPNRFPSCPPLSTPGFNDRHPVPCLCQ